MHNIGLAGSLLNKGKALGAGCSAIHFIGMLCNYPCRALG